MTKEECKYLLGKVEERFSKAINEIRDKEDVEKHQILQVWARENAKYQMGETITDGIETIVIDTISGVIRGRDSEVFIEYSGHKVSDGNVLPYKFAFILEDFVI